MSKKDVHYEEAERLFITSQFTINEIASRLKLSDKTVRVWKKEGDWDEKKSQYLKSKQSFHEELYEFSRKLMKGIQEDWDKGDQVDAGRLYTLTRMLPMITKVKDYEDVREPKDTPKDKQGLTEDTIKAIEKAVLGID